MKKILVSLKHTKPTDEFLTLWRPNDAGYTFSLTAAGKYEIIDLQPGYHDSENTYPIDQYKANDCAVCNDEYGTVIPNDVYTRDVLGLKIDGKKLVRK